MVHFYGVYILKVYGTHVPFQELQRIFFNHIKLYSVNWNKLLSIAWSQEVPAMGVHGVLCSTLLYIVTSPFKASMI